MVELKKAVESDMDRRDEAIHLNYATEDVFWHELHNQLNGIYNAIQDMSGLHEATLGKKQPSDKYIEHWDNLVGHNQHLANVLNHLFKNVQLNKSAMDRTGFYPDDQTEPETLINSNN